MAAMSWKKLKKLVEQDIPYSWLRVIGVVSIVAVIPATLFLSWYVFGYREDSETKFYIVSGVIIVLVIGHLIFHLSESGSYSGSQRGQLATKGWVKHPTKKDLEIERRWHYFFMPFVPITLSVVGLGFKIWPP